MGEWTGRWKQGSQSYKCCPCGNPKGILVQHQYFDAEALDAMKHDGEERIVDEKIICPNCLKNKR